MKKLNSGNFIKIFTIALSLAIMGACGSPNQENAQGNQEFEQAKEGLKEKINRNEYNLPDPSEVPYMIQATGAEFNQGLINDIGKVNQYQNTNGKAAVNLGVYAADIGYLTSYGKSQMALNYFKSNKELSDQIGLEGAFDLDMVQRFENNISNKDSLGKVVDDAINVADQFLVQNDRANVAAKMITGSFVESLYLATQLVENYPQDMLTEQQISMVLQPVVRLIAKQDKPLADLIQLLKDVEKDDQLNNLLAALNELHSDFERLSVEEKIEQGNAEALLSDEALNAITSKVENLRRDLVS